MNDYRELFNRLKNNKIKGMDQLICEMDKFMIQKNMKV
jgi:hypothetical protein